MLLWLSEIPRKVDVIKEKGSNTFVSWSHSLPKESKFYNDLKYTVVKVSGSCEETELEGDWKRGKKSMIVKGRHRRSLKVGACFKDSPKLGTVYSELYKGTHNYSVCVHFILY